MALQLDGFDLLETPADLLAGAPMQLPLALIDEDPQQPRQDFDPESLRELAETIRARGVRQPISVRRHPQQPGRWMLNFGARRLRASKLAGKEEIPAFVDHAADSYDQVIENEQREGLKPLELALFVQRRLAAGETQAEIAKRMGKSRQYVMIATALIDAPDWLMAAYRQGRCRGLNELHELRKLHGRHPQHVEAWASDGEAMTRERVQALRTSLVGESATTQAVASATLQADTVTPGSRLAGTGAPPSTHSHAPARPSTHRRLQARLGTALVWVVTDEVPADRGHVYVRSAGAPARQAVEASQLTLLGFGND